MKTKLIVTCLFFHNLHTLNCIEYFERNTDHQLWANEMSTQNFQGTIVNARKNKCNLSIKTHSTTTNLYLKFVECNK